MSTTPESFVLRLAALANEARHHPQPGVAVSLLAQLLLDLVTELQPIAQRYGLLLRTGGAAALLQELDKHMIATELQLGATALAGAQASTYQDLQPKADTVVSSSAPGLPLGGGEFIPAAQLVSGQAGHDPDRDTTGTAG